MKRNSGIIGPQQSTTVATGSGKFEKFDQYTAKLTASWPQNPEYISCVASPSSINEVGGSTIVTVTTSNVANGTTLYYTILGTGVNSSDLSPLSGSFAINNNTGSFGLAALYQESAVAENESFRVEIRTDSISGNIQILSNLVTILDSSVTVTPNVTSVNEGGTVTFTIAHTNITSGTSLNWSVIGTNITSSDFSDATTTGSYTFNGSNVQINRTLTNDQASEGTESFILRISTIGGYFLGQSASVTINDTSVPPPPPPPPPPGGSSFRNPVPVTSGSSNSASSPGICNIYYRRHIVAWVVTSSELSINLGLSSASIRGLRWYITGSPLYQPLPSYAIGMKNLSSGFGVSNNPGNTGYTIVKSASNESFTASSYKEFYWTSTPFNWTGGDLAIVVAWGQCPTNWNGSGQNVIANTSGSLFFAVTDSAGAFTINTDSFPNTATSNRPSTQFYI